MSAAAADAAVAEVAATVTVARQPTYRAMANHPAENRSGTIISMNGHRRPTGP